MRKLSIGVIGGTGSHGRGLAGRFALGGHRVLIGSRDEGRAAAVAAGLRRALPAGCESVVTGGSNAEVAADADLAVLAMPWEPSGESVRHLTDALGGKIVVSCMNPLGFDKHGAYRLQNEFGSAAEHTALLLPGSQVVGAFHHLSAKALLDLGGVLHGEDILVCGDHKEAKKTVRDLCVHLIGRRGIDAGPLRLARYIEPFTAVLISINRQYQTQSGMSVVRVPETAVG